MPEQRAPTPPATMKKMLFCALILVLGCGCLQARPRRASPREVIAFMRKDLSPLPAGTRFKRVHWNPAAREWEVTLEPPYIFGRWMVNPTATDYSHTCFF